MESTLNVWEDQDHLLCQKSNSRTENSREENASINEYFVFDNFYVTAYLPLEHFFKWICLGMFAHVVLETVVNAPSVHFSLQVSQQVSLCLPLWMPFTKQEKKSLCTLHQQTDYILLHLSLLFPGIFSTLLISFESNTYHQSFQMPQIFVFLTNIYQVEWGAVKNAFKSPQLHIK